MAYHKEAHYCLYCMLMTLKSLSILFADDARIFRKTNYTALINKLNIDLFEYMAES